MKVELEQLDDHTIKIFKNRTICQLSTIRVIPMTDNVQDSPRHESTIQNLAEDLFENDGAIYE